jgi:hypothetical protein
MRSSAVVIKLNVVELKLDRLMEEMRFLKSHTITFDTRLRGIEAYERSINLVGEPQRIVVRLDHAAGADHLRLTLQQLARLAQN